MLFDLYNKLPRRIFYHKDAVQLLSLSVIFVVINKIIIIKILLIFIVILLSSDKSNNKKWKIF